VTKLNLLCFYSFKGCISVINRVINIVRCWKYWKTIS